MSTVIATITQIIGNAWVRGLDGSTRPAQIGEALLEGETLVTESGAQVMLDLGAGETLALTGNQSLLMTPNMVTGTEPPVAESLVMDPSVDEILAALEGEGDLLEDLEAPAAGTDGAPDGGGSSFVRLTRISESVDPLAYNFDPTSEPGFEAPIGAAGVAEEPEVIPPPVPPSIDPLGGSVDETGGLEGFSAALNADFAGEGGVLVLSAPGATWNPATSTLLADNGTWQIQINPDGTYTFTQLMAMNHPNTLDPNDALDLTITATAISNNGLTATGTFVVTVYDDGPFIQVRGEQLDEDIVLATQDADTREGTDTDSQDFSGYFVVDQFDYGTDGAGDIRWSYSLSLYDDAHASGLSSGGQAIYLYDFGEGRIYGVTAEELESAEAIADGTLVFTLAVNPVTGQVTLTQHQTLDHAQEDSEDYALDVVSLGSELVKLTATAVITDADGDEHRHSAELDLAGKVSFDDDGPHIQIGLAELEAPIVLNTQDADTLEGPDSDVQNFAAAFKVLSQSFGADSGDTLDWHYSLGLYENVDAAMLTSSGQTIYLVALEGSIYGVLDSDVESVEDITSENQVFRLDVNALTGVVTLTQYRQVDHLGEGNDDSIALGAGLVELKAEATIYDSDGDKASHTASLDLGVHVLFDDDGPSLSMTNLAIANQAATYEGSFDFAVGADTQAFAESFGSSSLVWSNRPAGYDFALDPEASSASQLVYKATYSDGDETQTFFIVTVNSDGTYQFELVNPVPVNEVPVIGLLQGITGGSNLASYTFPSSMFGGHFDLVVTGYSDGKDGTLTISSTDLGVNDNVMHGNKGDILRFTVDRVDPAAAVSISQLTISLSSTAGVKVTDSAILRVYYTSGDPDTYSQVIGNDYELVYEIDPTRTVSYLELEPADDKVQFKIDGVSLNYVVMEYPDDYDLLFELTGSDFEGDTADASFVVSVHTSDMEGLYEITGSAESDYVYGTEGDDPIAGGAGDDVLTGGGGADTFIWNAEDEGLVGDPAVDRITDFSTGIFGNPEADRLDLRDLLVGEEENPLSHYLYAEVDTETSTTTLHISTQGGFSEGFDSTLADQVIILEGVELEGADSQEIVQYLIDNGQLLIDS